jgi:hypothetical protein
MVMIEPLRTECWEGGVEDDKVKLRPPSAFGIGAARQDAREKAAGKSLTLPARYAFLFGTFL